MPKFVIVRTSDGAYVAPRGSEKSYTKCLQNAQTWDSRDAAQKDCCGNETVVDFQRGV